MHHPNTAAFHGPATPLRRAAGAWASAALIALGLACGGKHHAAAASSTPTSYPPPIAVQPLDEVLTSGQTATFSVVASGSGTVTYQWYKTVAGTATAITGATAPTYTTPATALTDTASAYSVIVSSQFGTVTSRSAVLTVVANGAVSTFAGAAGSPGTGDGLGTAAHFLAPFGVANDGHGILYVADTGNHTIRRIDATGNVSTYAGTAGTPGHADANGTAATFNQPTGIAIDASGNLFVADSGNRTIRKISPAKDVTTLAGTAGVYGSTDATGPAASFAFPQGIVVDGTGNLFVADAYSNTIRKVTAAGVVTTLVGTAGTAGYADGTGTAAIFNQPMGLALDGSGNLYVADANNHLIRKVTTGGGIVTTLAGTAGQAGFVDGTGTAAKFHMPVGVALDASGNLYVADGNNRCVRKVDAAAAVTTQAGSSLNAGSADANGAAASFGQPTGLTIIGGNAYIVDATYGTVRKLIPGS